MSRPKAPAQQLEHREQRYYFELLTLQVNRYPELAWVHAIPNGARVGRLQAQKLVREGLRSGVSDVFVPIARGGYHGMYLEFKSPPDRLTGKRRGETRPNQKRFLAFAATQGYFCVQVDDRVMAYELTLTYIQNGIDRSQRSGLYEQHWRRP